ncbi:MAG: DNA mismatch repair protein MutS, partial [candidate division Zixibacteria bacterium]|nr:DNA mismatch repair protein MutS [candidate division Zixibacteria bacterium]
MATTQTKDTMTPMMRQYTAIKAKYPDHIVFFRMGDFYEMFGDDAVDGAEILGITLTKRPHGREGEIPLAGVPHHSAERYLAKLAESGRRVVICEQTEDPKLAKGVVKRDVVEIITPGTVMLDGALDDTVSPRIAAVMGPDERGQFGVAVAELTTGFFGVEICGPEQLIDLLRNNAPREVVIPHEADDALANSLDDSRNVSRWPDWRFGSDEASRQLKQHFGVSDLTGVGFGNSSGQIADVEVGSAGALLCYLKDMKCAPLTHITRVQHLIEHTSVPLDESTAANLDVIGRPGLDAPSLYNVLDRCRTPMGRRLLRHWLLNPLINRDLINQRLDCIAHLVHDRVTLRDLGEQLKGLFDAERFVGRLGAQRITPRDVASLRATLARWPEIEKLCVNSPLLDDDRKPDAAKLAQIHDHLHAALVDDPPNVTHEGGIFRREYNTELEDLYNGAAEARTWIAGLQKHLRNETGIPSLKVGYNKVFNYYIEVPRTHSAKVPDEWIRKQTLVGNERFITPELKDKEEIVLRADERAAALEEKLFAELRDQLTESMDLLSTLAQELARIDVLRALANGALIHGYERPTLADTRELSIHGGRHPVLETVNPAGQFVPNDTILSDDDGWMHILTGPNMAGKSTYLRQVGLIVLMAQIGSFVPADKAVIGVVDRIFTRVGADDDLTRNRSTFMVEMAETARILTGTTDRSLILFDEVGRGTSTYDGVAIAWSIAEHLVRDPQQCPRTLFATHYHELTALSDRFEAIRNYQLAVREKNEMIAFIYRVKPGACDDSFGIHVARMAGVPSAVINRANEILSALESGTFDPLKRSVGLRAKRTAVTSKQE